MNTPQPPLPAALLCLAILPVLITIGAYLFLAPHPPVPNPAPMLSAEETVALPPVGEQILTPEPEPPAADAPSR